MMVTIESFDERMIDESVSCKSSAGNIDTVAYNCTTQDVSKRSVVTAPSGHTADNIKGMSKEVVKHYDELTAKVFGVEVATTIAEILSDAEEKNRLSLVNMTDESDRLA